MIRSAVAALAAALVAVVIAPLPAGAFDDTWTRIATGTTGGVSGLAPAPASGWVIVRDNKSAGQNRVALLGSSGSVTPLTWPGAQPQDLEALAAVPASTGQYVALTSAGRGSVFSIAGTAVSVTRSFAVPRGTKNIESFALTQVGGSTIAVWAVRGSSTAAATVYAATFAPTTGVFGAVSSGRVSVPYPTTSLRQVADLTVVGGRLVGSATSDPGANGPFASAVYDLGTVSIKAGKAKLGLVTPVSLGQFAGHKVEGIACADGVGLLGSDDEKQGGWVRTADFCS